MYGATRTRIARWLKASDALFPEFESPTGLTVGVLVVGNPLRVTKEKRNIYSINFSTSEIVYYIIVYLPVLLLVNIIAVTHSCGKKTYLMIPLYVSPTLPSAVFSGYYET